MTVISQADRNEVHASLTRLEDWVSKSNWKAYDPFDGLSSPFSKYFTLGHPFLKQCWLHMVRRFPINLRPLLLVPPGESTKAMGFFAAGYLRMYQTYGDERYLKQMQYCLQWLMDNPSKGFGGHCWGNHFGGQTRGGYIARHTPTVVWTGLIAQAFLDAYDALGDHRYAEVAIGACEVFIHDLGWMEMDEGICIRYYPDCKSVVHNSSMIGAALLARVSALTGNTQYRDVAHRAVQWTVAHQTAEGAWAYGVGPMWSWIDSFHTGYILEALNTFCHYCGGTPEFERALKTGYDFYLDTFFGSDGTPRYYDRKTRPLDIQCASHGIQALVNLQFLHPQSVEVAVRVARWTIRHMQDPTGYFYYRKYPFVTNKTATLHWGEGTMFAALAILDRHLTQSAAAPSGPTQRLASAVGN